MWYKGKAGIYKAVLILAARELFASLIFTVTLMLSVPRQHSEGVCNLITITEWTCLMVALWEAVYLTGEYHRLAGNAHWVLKSRGLRTSVRHFLDIRISCLLSQSDVRKWVLPSGLRMSNNEFAILPWISFFSCISTMTKGGKTTVYMEMEHTDFQIAS